MIYEKTIKRLLDLCLVITSLPIIVPLSVLVAILVRIKIGAPIFYAQQRPGQHAKPFKMVKFRTMTNAVGPDGKLLPDDIRLTPFGKLLRKTSLDELPEFWNILKGDMSFVGPRPLLTRYLKRYSSEQRRRHDVRPGLTGLAQVSGRNLLNWEQKFELDVEYVQNCSLMLDMSILFKTIKVVLSSKGVSSANEVTMPEFMGSDSNNS